MAGDVHDLLIARAALGDVSDEGMPIVMPATGDFGLLGAGFAMRSLARSRSTSDRFGRGFANGKTSRAGGLAELENVAVRI